MKRIVCLLLAILLLLCGCAEEDKPYVPTGSGLAQEETQPTAPQQTVDEELVMVYDPDEPMNPLKCADCTNRALFSLIYQGLFTVDRDYQVKPILCSRYTVSPDMRVYTFYVTDATFSDGTPLTSKDVVESLKAAMYSSVFGGRFTHVSEVEQLEDGGIRVRMDTPYENLPLLLDVPIMRSWEVWEDHPLGTGPYCFEQTATTARLRRIPDWWCSAELAVKAPVISLRVAESTTQVRDAFEFSNVELVCADPNSDGYADFRCDYELWDCENGGFLFLGCNMNSPYFSIAALRAALTYAIDRNAIAEDYYHGFARPANLCASAQSPYYNTALAQRYEYDPYHFAEAMTEVELPVNEEDPEESLPVRLLVNGNDSLRLRVANRIKQMLTDVGLTVEVVPKDYEDFLEALKKGDYDLYLGQTRLSANMDLSAFFAVDGSLNYGAIQDASLYALCLESLANQGNYYNLHSRIAEDGRICPILFQSYAIYAARGEVSGLTPARDAVFYYDFGISLSDILSDE